MFKESEMMPHRLGIMIIRTATLLRRRAKKNVYMNQLHTISGPNGWILQYLDEHEGEDIYQKDIEENFSVTPSAVSKSLKIMEEKGVIRRETVRNDARLKRLILTDEGRSISRQALKEMMDLEKQIEKNLTKQEITTLQELLERISANIIEME